MQYLLMWAVWALLAMTVYALLALAISFTRLILAEALMIAVSSTKEPKSGG